MKIESRAGEGCAHIGKGEMAKGGAGRELRQEVEGVAEELQGAQIRQSAQVDHWGGQPVALQRHLPQLAAVPNLNCVQCMLKITSCSSFDRATALRRYWHAHVRDPLHANYQHIFFFFKPWQIKKSMLKTSKGRQ